MTNESDYLESASLDLSLGLLTSIRPVIADLHKNMQAFLCLASAEISNQSNNPLALTEIYWELHSKFHPNRTPTLNRH